MNITDFLQKFAAEFEMTEPEEITPSTNYRELDEWDSLLGLAIIGMVNNNYGVKIKGEEVKDCKSVQQLFDLIASKK